MSFKLEKPKRTCAGTFLADFKNVTHSISNNIPINIAIKLQLL